jgi:murein DD-endopeptidase MepM/ murein hydrolase activator NlpD
MQRCLLALSVLVGSPSVPALASADPAKLTTVAVQPIAQAATQDIVAGLPTGGDGNYQRHMLGWNAPAAPAGARRSIAVSEPLALPIARITRLSSRFGVRSDPLGMGHRMHSGIDIPGALGTSVMATGPGVVAFVGWAGGYGNLVVIDHGNGLRTRYGHLLRPLVSPGEVVAMGSVIGLMGSTGRSTGSHLHYEIRIDGAAVNPLASGYVAHGYVSEADDVPARPVVERWQGWGRSEAAGELPLSVIR